MSYFAGIDVGSRTSKAVVWDGGKIAGMAIIPTGWTPEASAREVFGAALKEARLEGVDRIVATGYGRLTVPFAERKVTEITAHATGALQSFPEAATLIDIGGQDSKAILLRDGLVADFAMNDRCAAGSGKFLEFLAHTLDLSVQEFAQIALESKSPATITSICTVFAESEMLSLIAEGVRREDVAAGVHRAIAQRVARMAQALNPEPPFVFTGGVAKNSCMVSELGLALGGSFAIPEHPQFTGALGAALIASRL